MNLSPHLKTLRIPNFPAHAGSRNCGANFEIPINPLIPNPPLPDLCVLGVTNLTFPISEFRISKSPLTPESLNP